MNRASRPLLVPKHIAPLPAHLILLGLALVLLSAEDLPQRIFKFHSGDNLYGFMTRICAIIYLFVARDAHSN